MIWIDHLKKMNNKKLEEVGGSFISLSIQKQGSTRLQRAVLLVASSTKDHGKC